MLPVIDEFVRLKAYSARPLPSKRLFEIVMSVAGLAASVEEKPMPWPRVADEAVVVDEDVGQRAAGVELVGVDAVPAGRAGLTLLFRNRLRWMTAWLAPVVGQAEADDVVLDDVVEDLRRPTCPSRKATAEPGKVAFVLF